MTAPIYFAWDGEAMAPLPRFAKMADKKFVVGMNYPMVVHEERSRESHSHYFAALSEAWKNLPEEIADRFPTSEHLRKFALVKAGFADERSIVCSSKAEALRVAAFVKPMDDYAIVLARDTTVKVFTAQSQSMRAMGKKDFQASKQAVLDIVAGMIGVAPATLSANAPSISPDAPHRQREHAA